MLARKAAPRLVRINDARGVWQYRARQMVVGDQHVDAEFGRTRDAIDAGDAVVDRDQQVRLALRGEFDDLRRQPVAVLEAVGHQIIDFGLCAPRQHAQSAQTDRGGSGAIAVIVGDDQQSRIRFERVGEQHRRFRDMRQFGRCDEALQRQLQLGVAGNAAGR